ncbi:hypothetical protein [Actinocrispum sp. NPDC049592]|uniref:hypothetical protein n=1 Tax=Actinocrispum sp. NPDC049592 TaxID=3154835 RepID=UPI00342C9B34
MMDSSTHARFAELVRAELASGAGFDDVLGLLRQRGLRKGESMMVMAAAMDPKPTALKSMVHLSPVWADHREGDEAAEEMLFRALFVMCVMGEGEISAPAEDAAECEERRQRARTQLRDVAAGLPDETLNRYHELMAKGLLGQAFAALVAVGHQHGADDVVWCALAEVAETLCLNELLGDDEPVAGADDSVRAAYIVRQFTA